MVRPILVALLLVACQPANRTDPVTGKSYYSPLGNDFASQDEYVRSNYLAQLAIARDGGLLPEPEITEACGEIFLNIIRSAPQEHRRGFEFYFFVTASPQVNAYTYGGGRIHCLLGLVAECEDAAELAGVLAHELGHVSHDHIGQQIGSATRFRGITSFGGILRGPGRRLTESIGGLIGGPILLSHSRAHEREADDRAVDYTAAAGIDPDGLARWFERLSRGEKRGLQFLRTHPYSSDRVGRIRARIEAGGHAGAGVRTTPGFERARARAREILPYYLVLHEALATDDADTILRAAAAGIGGLPHHPQFHFWKGAAHEVKEERDEALDAMDAAVKRDHSNVLYPYVLAILAFDSKRWVQAEDAAGRALSIVPALPAAWLIRGLSRYEQGKKTEAYEDFDVLVEAAESDHDKQRTIDEIRKQAPDYRK